jgi:WD40 repeat protein
LVRATLADGFLVPPLHHDGPVVAATAKGERVVTASADNTARIWDARNGEPIGKTLHHDGPVWAATFARGRIAPYPHVPQKRSSNVR